MSEFKVGDRVRTPTGLVGLVVDRAPTYGDYRVDLVIGSQWFTAADLEPAPAPVDWPARFRAAKAAANRHGAYDVADHLRDIAEALTHRYGSSSVVVGAIGRELGGGT